MNQEGRVDATIIETVVNGNEMQSNQRDQFLLGEIEVLKSQLASLLKTESAHNNYVQSQQPQSRQQVPSNPVYNPSGGTTKRDFHGYPQNRERRLDNNLYAELLRYRKNDPKCRKRAYGGEDSPSSLN
eukprot:Tbor_TRINITY_DN5587_c0_g1::TRINITY_DN5587_c0_g1_i1::g.13434::m.13434